MTTEIEKFRAAITEKYRGHMAAFEAEDFEWVVQNFFTPDAFWAAPGFPTREGREELRVLFREAVKVSRVQFHSLKSFVSGDFGWDYVDYPIQPTDPTQQTWGFRPLFVWRRIQGEWFVHCCVSYQRGAEDF